MLGLRAQRITFGCPAGNIAGGYGIKIATDQMFMIILSRTSTLVDRSDRTLQSEIAARDERTLNRHQHSSEAKIQGISRSILEVITLKGVYGLKFNRFAI